MPRPLTDYAFTAGLLLSLLAIAIQRDWSGSDFSAGLLGLQDSKLLECRSLSLGTQLAYQMFRGRDAQVDALIRARGFAKSNQ